jgi:hypothetical protein
MKRNSSKPPAFGQAGWVANLVVAATLTLGTGLGYAAQNPPAAKVTTCTRTRLSHSM